MSGRGRGEGSVAGRHSVSSPPHDLGPDHDVVDVYRFSLAVPRERVARYERTLAPDERRRATRFRSARDARRFVVARGVLRSVLGRYAGRDPHAIEFCYGRGGKPELAPPWTGVRLRFNLAHSADLAVIAVAHRRRVGIDLEAVRPVPELDRLALRYFSTRERHELGALPHEARLEAFFRGWTRKEALSKATGAGLDLPFDRIEVPLEPHATATVVTIPGADGAAFVLAPVDAGGGFAAAVAVEGGTTSTRVRMSRGGTYGRPFA